MQYKKVQNKQKNLLNHKPIQMQLTAGGRFDENLVVPEIG